MPRRKLQKSAAQLSAQAERIMHETAVRSWNRNGGHYDDDTTKRMERIHGIWRRYVDNISASFGNREWLSNDNYEKQVSRRIYMGLSNG